MPAICRDEIKEGTVHAVGGPAAAPGDELTRRTFPVFFAVLRLLLEAQVSVVAEAAFQKPPLAAKPRTAGRVESGSSAGRAEVATLLARRRVERGTRAAHGDGLMDVDTRRIPSPLGSPCPPFDVDTTAGYEPELPDIVAFINS